MLPKANVSVLVLLCAIIGTNEAATVNQRLAQLEEELAAMRFNSRDSQDNKNDIPVGTILPFSGASAPNGWLPCDGRQLSIADYLELYSVIRDAFTKSALSEYFQIPDLRGRTIIGVGGAQVGGKTTNRNMGDYLGSETVTLTSDQMPQHKHRLNDNGHQHTYGDYYPCNAVCLWHYFAFEDYKHYPYDSNCNTDRSSMKSVTGITMDDAGSSRPHDIMQPSGVVNFVIKYGEITKPPTTPAPSTTTTIAMPLVTSWPKPQYLQGFWPLNSEYTIHDVSQHRFNGKATVANRPMTGPFGGKDTAMEPSSANTIVLEVSNERLSVANSFTVSLFFKRGDDNEVQEGGIFEFVDKYNTEKAFQFRYVNKTTVEVSANNFVIGEYTIVQQNGVWTFMAFVFDGTSALFTAYGRHGVVSPPSMKANVYASNSFNNNGIKLGWTTRWSQGLRATDAVSCLMIYSTALNAQEIRQVYDACRVIHNSPPCGSPKLALAPIPAATAVTTIPRPGQFPYVASVRRSDKHICSASIVDNYWLLTSSTCFDNVSDLSLYSVYIGEFDLNVTESYTRKHLVSKVIAGNRPRDLALIEVSPPIDFANDYVNDACFFRSENAGEVKIDMTQYVFGWGANGRQPMISTSVPRYAPGLTMTDSQCARAWGEDYSPNKDFCFMSASSDKNVPCVGDEGGALLMQAHANSSTGVGDRLVQVAVYYKRDANCTVTKPALFTNVAQYSKWIAEKLACTLPGVYYPDSCPQ